MNSTHARIIGEGVPVVAEQPAARRALRQKAVRLHVAMLHVDVAVPETERCDDAVTVERVGIAHLRRKLLIGADPEEGAVQRLRNLALDLEIEERSFEPERLVDRHEGGRLGKGLGHAVAPNRA